MICYDYSMFFKQSFRETLKYLRGNYMISRICFRIIWSCDGVNWQYQGNE